jgi:hypothetical protein
VRVVGDAIGRIDNLRLEAEAVAVLEQRAAHLVGEIEAGEVGVLALEHIDDAQRLLVMFEAAVVRHAIGQRVLAGVSERAVPEIVGERDGLGEVLVETECSGDGARDLRDLHRVGEPRAVVVAETVDEDLRLVLQAPERGGVDDPIPVALKRGAVGMLRLLVRARSRVERAACVGRELALFAFLQRVPRVHPRVPFSGYGRARRSRRSRRSGRCRR